MWHVLPLLRHQKIFWRTFGSLLPPCHPLSSVPFNAFLTAATPTSPVHEKLGLLARLCDEPSFSTHDWPSTPSFSFLLYDCLFMCVVYVFVMSVCTHTCVLGCACTGVETKGIFLDHCSPYCLRQRFSMNMEIIG